MITTLKILESEKIINSTYLNMYKKNMKTIQFQIVELNTNIFLLNKIIEFPFTIFNQNNSESIFWENTLKLLFESCVLIIWRVSIESDKKDKILPINKLKSQIYQNLKSQSFKDIFDHEAPSIDFRFKYPKIKQKVEQIRHNLIAHINEKAYGLERRVPQYGISLSEIEALCKEIDTLFKYLCFKNEIGTLPLSISKYVEQGNTDIDHIFDSLVKTSVILHMPENEPDYWPYYKQNFAPKDLEIFNKYRIKFNLPKV